MNRILCAVLAAMVVCGCFTGRVPRLPIAQTTLELSPAEISSLLNDRSHWVDPPRSP